MIARDKKDLATFMNGLSTPLSEFYKREATQGADICFVQPNPDGSVDKLTWGSVAEQVRRMAAYLRSLNYESGSNIALMSNNCAHWIMADLAIWMAGHVSVPLYPVLTAKTVRQILEHSGAKAMFVGKLTGFDEMKAGIPDALHLLSFPLSPADARAEYVDWDEIIANYEPISDNPTRLLDELATIIYTSGTTGVPKGVMHSFRNFAIVGIQAGEMYSMNSEDRKISYLPLAHAAERVAIEANQLYTGYTTYFSDSLATFPDDLKRARPTLFFAVPRIWAKFQQRVYEQISEGELDKLLKSPETSADVRNMITSSLGLDQLRVGVSGAAPLSTSLMEWYKKLGIEILEGYGMTENLAYSHATRSGESRIGAVGTVSTFVECRISDVGEVLVKSPANMLGYYKEPALTSQALDEDGFIHTGDKGEIDGEGRLKITGRIKEMFKTSKGKYVAPAPIEDLLSSDTSIEQVCVTGSQLMAPIGLLTLTEQAASALADDSARLQLSARLESVLMSTNAQLDKHEQLATLVVMPSQWTVENNMMTPTLKVKRSEIDDNFQHNYENWCTTKEKVLFVTDA